MCTVRSLTAGRWLVGRNGAYAESSQIHAKQDMWGRLHHNPVWHFDPWDGKAGGSLGYPILSLLLWILLSMHIFGSTGCLEQG